MAGRAGLGGHQRMLVFGARGESFVSYRRRAELL
jgi:hypothetical protein